MEQDIDKPRIGTTSLSSAPGDSRRQELANFLRRRRESLEPEEIGMPRTARRRVRGLRREEVAEAAGISAAWYTWIEQARDLNLSISTLEGISRALRLDEDERTHLFELAEQPVPSTMVAQNDQAMKSLKAMLEGFNPNPAYALDSYWQIVAWNRGFEILFGNLDAVTHDDRNYIRLLFTSPRLKALFVNWEEVAGCAVAHFRSDSSGLVNDLRWLALVSDMEKQSPVFHRLWKQHNVAWPHMWRKELALADGNKMYDSFDLSLSRPLRLRVVTYIPSETPGQ